MLVILQILVLSYSQFFEKHYFLSFSNQDFFILFENSIKDIKSLCYVGLHYGWLVRLTK